ncbi:aspartate aminotransferase family protein, partial [Rhizobium johnstonii]
AALTAKVAYRAWQLGVVAYPVRGNVLELTPPLTISADTVREAADILARAIDDAVEGAVSDEQVAAFGGW